MSKLNFKFLNLKDTLAKIFSCLYKHSSLKLVIYRYHLNAPNYIPFPQPCSLIISLDHLIQIIPITTSLQMDGEELVATF